MSRRHILVTPKSYRCVDEGNQRTDDITIDLAMNAMIMVNRASYSYEVGDHGNLHCLLCRCSALLIVID